MNYDYLIVGAGLTGTTFARLMTDRGKRCLVIERRKHIGGNVYTETVENIHVHRYGAHIFHTNNDNVWTFVNRFAVFNDFVNSPIANYKGERYNLPFNMNTFRQMWGVTTAEDAQAKIYAQISDLNIGEPKNLEEQALKMVGRDIYEKLVKGYTEKQWGRACADLPAFIIRRLPLRFTYDNNYFNAKYQGIPVGGYTRMVEKMLDEIPVVTDTDYFDFIKNTSDTFNKTLYTGKIDAFFDFSCGTLEYRTVSFDTQILDMPNFQGNAVVNYTDRETPYTRIIEHKHFEKSNSDKTVVSYEYPAEWTEGAEAYYPVNDDKNEKALRSYRFLAKNLPDIIMGGRLGEYKYYDMDTVIERAAALAECEN